MGDLVARLGALAGQFAASRHHKTLGIDVLYERLPRPKKGSRPFGGSKGSLEDRGRIGTAPQGQANGARPTPGTRVESHDSRICLDRVMMRRQTWLGWCGSQDRSLDAPRPCPACP